MAKILRKSQGLGPKLNVFRAHETAMQDYKIYIEPCATRSWRSYPGGQNLPLQVLRRDKSFIFLYTSPGYGFR